MDTETKQYIGRKLATLLNPPAGANGVGGGSALETFDIKNYGAVCDGVTSDALAVAAALNAAIAAGGGEVVNSGGVAHINQNLGNFNLAESIVKFTCKGTGAYRISGAIEQMMAVSGAEFFALDGMRFVAKYHAPGDPQAAIPQINNFLIQFGHINKVLIRNTVCYGLRSAGTHGIFWSYNAGLATENLFFLGCSSYIAASAELNGGLIFVENPTSLNLSHIYAPDGGSISIGGVLYGNVPAGGGSLVWIESVSLLEPERVAYGRTAHLDKIFCDEGLREMVHLKDGRGYYNLDIQGCRVNQGALYTLPGNLSRFGVPVVANNAKTLTVGGGSIFGYHGLATVNAPDGAGIKTTNVKTIELNKLTLDGAVLFIDVNGVTDKVIHSACDFKGNATYPNGMKISSVNSVGQATQVTDLYASTAPPPSPLLLNTLSVMPFAAYSMRRVNNLYNGAVCKVRPFGSGGAFTSINAVSGWADVTAMQAVGMDLEVLMFDQSGVNHQTLRATDDCFRVDFTALGTKPCIKAAGHYNVIPNLQGQTFGEVFCSLKSYTDNNIAGTANFWNFGTSAQGNNYPYLELINDDFGSTTRRTYDAAVEVLTNWNVYNVRSAANDWQLKINGVSRILEAVNTVAFPADSHIRLGVTGSYGFAGEMFIFNTPPTSGDRTLMLSGMQGVL